MYNALTKTAANNEEPKALPLIQGTVIQCQDDQFCIQTPRQDTVWAKQAAGCFLTPQPGDTVLAIIAAPAEMRSSQLTHNQAFILSVLTSHNPEAAELHLPHSTTLKSTGSIHVQAQHWTLLCKSQTLNAETVLLNTHTYSLQINSRYQLKAQLIDEACTGVKRSTAKIQVINGQHIGLSADKVLIN